VSGELWNGWTPTTVLLLFALVAIGVWCLFDMLKKP